MSDFGIPALTGLLAPEELAWLASLGKRQSYADGETIHEQGNPNPGMGIVVSGQMKMIKHRANGQIILETMLYPGQLYGDIPTLFQTRHTHGAIAVGETVIDYYPGPEFRQLLEHPGILRALYQVICFRHFRAIELLDDMRLLPTEVRLAKLLAGMLSKADATGRIECLQEDLANLIGVTSVTLAKAFSALKREQLVETGYRHVRVPDPDSLRLWLAERDPQ